MRKPITMNPSATNSAQNRNATTTGQVWNRVTNITGSAIADSSSRVLTGRGSSLTMRSDTQPQNM